MYDEMLIPASEAAVAKNDADDEEAEDDGQKEEEEEEEVGPGMPMLLPQRHDTMYRNTCTCT